MSQIGNGDGGLEMIGRLLGGVDGKAGRVAAKLGGGASQDFARLMASAQGRMSTGEAPSMATDAGSKGMPALPDQLRSALSALGDEVARLREQLASGTPGQLASDQSGDQGFDGVLEQLVEGLSARRGQLSAGNGTAAADASVSADQHARGRPGKGGAAIGSWGQQGPAAAAGSSVDGVSFESSRPQLSADLSVPGAGTAMERLAADEAFAGEVAGLAQALADWREALGAGTPAQTEAAATALRDRLAALRESMRDVFAGSDQPPGLTGQMQALQQLLMRADSARSAEAVAARGAGEARSWSEWSWRLAGGGQSNASRSAAPSTVPLGGSSGSGGDNPDWSGGPVTAALGLVGREMPAAARSDRPEPAHWSVSGGAGSPSADAGMETIPASGVLGQSTSSGASSLTSGSPTGGIFTGQSANPSPNPQMPAQLGQQIQWMVGKGVSRANIELRPADLGPLKISIETQGDETRIALTATNATTQGLLEQQLPRLKEWLQESGLAHSEVDVSLGEEGAFGQQLADADGDESDGAGDRSAETGTMTASGAPMDGDGPVEWTEGQGVLDLFA